MRKFIKVPLDVMEDERLKKSDKMVYLSLCRYADNETRECYPSRKSLEKFSGVSNRTLTVSLQTLETFGYVEIRKRFHRSGRKMSNYYVLK